MSRRAVLAGLLGVAAAGAAGCAGGDGGADEASCPPPRAALEVEARNVGFDRGCLVAPAEAPFTIELANRDSLPHNVAIRRPEGPEDLFAGEVLTRPGRTTYEVPPLTAGTYVFYCTVHPRQMTGRFVAAE